MAMSDLVTELQKESFKVDAENERKICAVSAVASPPLRPPR